MARLIQKTGFISRKSAGDYMKYIATREGVEVLTGKGPTTEKQKEMVTKLLKDFPDMRDSFEYEDYKQAPTLHTASALISAALDSHMQNLQSENGYLKYIATRPGAEKHGAHGLFGREDNANLTAAMHDLTSHDGNVWTIIYSLHREDAERLGYNNAAAWRKLLISQQNKFSEAFHIPASALHWYAAYHDADTHPHIHMMIWTDQETVLKRDAVVKLRSAMTNSIFQAELENLYIRKGAEGPVMQELKDLCMRHRLRWQEVPVEKLNRLTRGNHQGVVAQTAAIAYVELADILERVPEDETPLVVVFDGVTDVRNFGAIARSAECAGAHGLIVPLKNSAPVNAEAIRSSAGALTTIPVCRVGSVRNTLRQLQTEGFQVAAATEKSRKLLYDADFRRPTAIVMGAEDTGVSREVLKLCDEQLAIPMIGRIESLNVSAAAAVMLFEAVRQRIGE